ncbi:MAG: tetratricopeptide repeat protein [candidate division Zixibacteria bacterium]|nr:tetratricopeptide repeat protein [candidate division Zixibacteria bacterium]
MEGIIIGIIGLFLAILVPVIGVTYKRRKKLKSYFTIIWKKSSSLKPKEVLGDRPYYNYYYERDEDNFIRNSLTEKKNLLIMGPPLGGKTRAAYQALKNVKKPYDVLIPRFTDINLETFIFPRHFKFWRKRIIFIDDLHRFVEIKNFDHLLKVAKEKSVFIVATCRSGMECDKVKNIMVKMGMDFERIFSETVELGKVSKDEGEKISKQVGINWKDVRFDGTIGSVFMRLSEMERRFDNECKNEEKTILQAMRDLYICGIYEERQVFPLEGIKKVAKKDGLEGKDYQWSDWLDKLKSKEFITKEKEKVRAEEVHLEYVVKPRVEKQALELFSEMVSVFKEVPDALVRLGNRAYETGIIKLEKKYYMKTAIRAYEEALEAYTLEDFPMDYGMTRNNLGTAYRTLGEVEEKAENCKKAIKAYEESLKVYTLDDFPMQYGMTQNNLGNAYSTLGEVEEKVENCKKAIKAYEEALKVRTLDDFPMDYGMTQNNLGTAYRTLGEVEEKVENCKKAIKAYEEALRVRTLDDFPMDYGMTQNNLGTAYWTLAEVGEKAENCRRAKKAFEEALKIYTKEKFPEPHLLYKENLINLLDFCKDQL